MPKVVIETGTYVGLIRAFERTLLVGRGSSCDLSLNEKAVSRQHAMLRWARGECYLTDLGSANGTFVGSTRITRPTRLGDNDVVIIGNSQLRVVLRDSPPADTLDDKTLTWVEPRRGTSTTTTVAAAEGGRAALRAMDSRTAADAMSRQLQFLDGLAGATSRGGDAQALLSFVLDELFALLPRATRAFILLSRAESEDLTLACARSRHGSIAAISASRVLIDRAVANREGILASEGSPVERTVLYAPILFDGRIFGAIQVDAEGGRDRFGEPDLAVLTDAEHIGWALAYMQFQEREIERQILQNDLAVARTVQQQFLPQRLPDLPGFEFAVAFVPAFTIGGDFYDVLDLSGGVLGLSVGDVCGKGIAAALYGARVMSDLRYLSIGNTRPADILRRVNHVLAARDSDAMFVTCVLAALDPARRRLSVSSAGQPLPLLRTPAGDVRPIGATGNGPIGITPDAAYSQHEHRLAEGETILFYSDGVTEALNGEAEPFGEDRLIDALRRCRGSASDVVGEVRKALSAHVGNAAPSDDTTLLCMRFTG